MASSSAEIFQKIRDAVDIVDVIGEHVALKRAGREFKALCPFHDDHRPSMAVVPHKQIFHCFVCQTGGDVFKFVREFHKMTPGEALRFLANKAGITLPELSGGDGRKGEGKGERERIAELNELACQFFEKQLRLPQGKGGLDYLRGRGLSDQTIAQFRLGMAIDSWTALTNHALRLGIRADELELAGLVKKRSDGSAYDVFRNRVIFPIIDPMGRIIAFGGRVLEEKRDDSGNVIEAKYLNTPETRLFNKSQSLYGLNFARQSIVRTRTAVVVEGYMDVIACHQSGVTNAVATLGTALTLEHIRSLKNYAQTVALVFDSDDAGFRAADRALEVFVKSPLDVRLNSAPDGKDPCDFCMKHGGEAFQKLVDEAPDALTYKWRRVRSRFAGTDSVAAKQSAVREFLTFAGSAIERPGAELTTDPIRKGLLISKIANLVGMDIDQVVKSLGLRHKENLSAQSHSTPDAEERAENWVVGCLLNEPALYSSIQESFSDQLFPRLHLHAALLAEYIEYLHESEGFPRENFLADFTYWVENETVAATSILLQREVEEWLDPQMLSENVRTQLAVLSQERGLTIAGVLDDCFKYLLRSATKRAPAFRELTEEDHFEEIREIAERNALRRNIFEMGWVKFAEKSAGSGKPLQVPPLTVPESAYGDRKHRASA
jgi:DNA primase catalytic core